MRIGGGSIFTDRLFGAKATCPVCRNQLTFQAGAELAKENGIYDNVVMCGRCCHVYACMLIPGNLALTDDVTERYPGALTKAVRIGHTGAETEAKPGKKKGFLSGLFRKG